MSERKNSEARIRANAKYNAKTYHRYAINTRIEDVERINVYKQQQGFTSDSGLFNAAIKYCIDNQIPLDKLNKD